MPNRSLPRLDSPAVFNCEIKNQNAQKKPDPTQGIACMLFSPMLIYIMVRNETIGSMQLHQISQSWYLPTSKTYMTKFIIHMRKFSVLKPFRYAVSVKKSFKRQV